MRKRNIIIGIAVLEILAIPAAAHLHSNLDFKQRTHVIAAEIKAPDGVKSYFVSSDGPFVVIGNNLSGNVQIALEQQGQLGDVRFGDTAQLPGPDRACFEIDSEEAQVVYKGSQGTITQKDDVVAGAVLFTLFHNPKTDPNLQFVRPSKADDLTWAGACR